MEEKELTFGPPSVMLFLHFPLYSYNHTRYGSLLVKSFATTTNSRRSSHDLAYLKNLPASLSILLGLINDQGISDRPV